MAAKRQDNQGTNSGTPKRSRTRHESRRSSSGKQCHKTEDISFHLLEEIINLLHCMYITHNKEDTST